MVVSGGNEINASKLAVKAVLVVVAVTVVGVMDGPRRFVAADGEFTVHEPLDGTESSWKASQQLCKRIFSFLQIFKP